MATMSLRVLLLVGSVGVAMVLLGGSVVSAQAQEADRAGRLAGADRFETAVEISEAAFPDGGERVYLARAGEFADALAAGVLTDGPILLVPQCGALPEASGEVIEQTMPLQIMALGGQAAVCDDALTTAADQAPTLLQYLSEDGMTPVQDVGSWRAGTAQIDGQVYAKSLQVAPSSEHTYHTGYDLARGYEAFRATVGVRDDGDTDARMQIDVYADDELRTSKRVTFGDTIDLDVDVDGVLRLRLEVTQLARIFR